jgi:hypothetical protein
MNRREYGKYKAKYLALKQYGGSSPNKYILCFDEMKRVIIKAIQNAKCCYSDMQKLAESMKDKKKMEFMIGMTEPFLNFYASLVAGNYKEMARKIDNSQVTAQMAALHFNTLYEPIIMNIFSNTLLFLSSMKMYLSNAPNAYDIQVNRLPLCTGNGEQKCTTEECDKTIVKNCYSIFVTQDVIRMLMPIKELIKMLEKEELDVSAPTYSQTLFNELTKNPSYERSIAILDSFKHTLDSSASSYHFEKLKQNETVLSNIIAKCNQMFGEIGNYLDNKISTISYDYATGK